LKSDDKDKSVDTVSERDENFVSRWSRRKRESGQVDAGNESAAQAPVAQEGETAGHEPERALTDEDMPPLEELGEESDYSAFLSSGVSEKLRQTALRKLFRSAKFNICDGLDDYAEDYTKFVALGDVVTADMRHRVERVMQKLSADGGEGESGPGATLGDEPETASDDAASNSAEAAASEATDEREESDDTDRV
jgi:hypothetical protein